MADAIVGGMFGVLVGVILVLILLPDHKSNCDNFGATTLGRVVYTCAPRTAK